MSAVAQGGIELGQEEGAPVGLVGLADGSGLTLETLQRPEEAPVGLVLPADVARASPAGATEAVEAAVVAGPEAGIGLDVVTSQLTELGPGVEEPREAGHHHGDGIASFVLGRGQRGFERRQGLAGLGVEDRLGRATRRQGHGGIGHPRTLWPARCTVRAVPESLDADTLRTVALVALGVLAVLGLLIMRMIQKMVLRVVLLGVLVGLGLFVWAQRAQLADCRCGTTCQVAGLDVEVPDCPDL